MTTQEKLAHWNTRLTEIIAEISRLSSTVRTAENHNKWHRDWTKWAIELERAMSNLNEILKSPTP